jgi:hypothetical protein
VRMISLNSCDDSLIKVRSLLMQQQLMYKHETTSGVPSLLLLLIEQAFRPFVELV